MNLSCTLNIWTITESSFYSMNFWNVCEGISSTRTHHISRIKSSNVRWIAREDAITISYPQTVFRELTTEQTKQKTREFLREKGRRDDCDDYAVLRLFLVWNYLTNFCYYYTTNAYHFSMWKMLTYQDDWFCRW